MLLFESLFFKIAGIGNLVIIADKYCVYIIEPVNQLHALLGSQQEAGGTEGVCSEGGIGDDCDGRRDTGSGSDGFS